jgi:hypothetical protein
MRITLEQDQAWENADKRFRRIKSRFRAYCDSAMKDLAIAYKMHWIDSISSQKYRNFPKYNKRYARWKKNTKGVSLPNFAFLNGDYIKAIGVETIADGYIVKIDESADTTSGFKEEKSLPVWQAVTYFEYGRPFHSEGGEQPPRRMVPKIKDSYRYLYNKYLKQKFGRDWPKQIAAPLRRS